MCHSHVTCKMICVLRCRYPSNSKNSDTNFASVCYEYHGQSRIYDSITRPQDRRGLQLDDTIFRKEEYIYDSITRPHDLCGLHNLKTVYREESDHKDNHKDATQHSMCGSNMSSNRMS